MSIDFKRSILARSQRQPFQQMDKFFIFFGRVNDFARDRDLDFLRNIKTATEQLGALQYTDRHAHRRFIRIEHLLQTPRINRAEGRVRNAWSAECGIHLPVSVSLFGELHSPVP